MKKTITLALSVCLVACLAINVSATAPIPSSGSWTTSILPVQSSFSYDNALPVCGVSNLFYYHAATSYDSNPVYACAVVSNNRLESYYFFCVDQCSVFNSLDSSSSLTYLNSAYPDSENTLFYIGGSGANWSDFVVGNGIATFESLAAAEQSFSEFLSNPSIPIVSSFSIPAGWVAYFKTNNDVNLSCVQADYSMVGNNPFATNNQMYGFANSLPASGTTFPFSGMSVIPWQKGGNRNIWGQTRDSVALINNGSVYTVVYNPTSQEGVGGSGTAADDQPNGAITITGTNISDIRIYPLSGQFINTGNGYHFVSGSDAYDTNYVDGVIDSETGSVVFEDTNGNVVVPNVGGQNSIPEIASAEGFFSAIKQILVGIANDLGTIFGFAYEAVVTLVSTASAFVATLGGLYAWLPSPLSSVLISAITLAITIGVFKVFM